MPHSSRGPLEGILVIDLSRVLSGPYCSLVLADLGARVIKVEQPGAGDDARRFPPFVNGRSAYFAAVNRGKESIALDLKDAPDRETFERLLDRADVLLDNFRPRVLARLGYGPELIEQRWPTLVHASISGFGQTGPYAGRAAYDLMMQAMAGIMSITGAENGGPARVGTSIADITAGLFATIGVLAALHARPAGRGHRVDISMFACQVAILEHALMRAQTGDPPRRLGARFPTTAPADAFRTRDGWIVIGTATDREFAAVMQTLGLRDLIDEPRFATMAARVANQAELKQAIEAVTATASMAHWDRELSAAGLSCGPVRTPAELLDDPQLAADGMLLDAGGVKVAGNPVRISGYPPLGPAVSAPELDEARQRILKDLE